ncbi:MAG: SUMF1/EgtB/PvdO family nonheme iron enzyme [Magnetococcales bacterium]|nr:SUMF1/EgtB/PvdO family nonheme iron enzyme [Magnetococcales bacterium]MBF0149113.1 SUMF1/EgtB/PvdO family nonheme iron enzyme [Magnetococcales bacterium]MBF0173232.1 SUMF1/EgtB/PvdO family nonheme iron enzyme [Magnetococcales bacterium]MBF0632205.1 SUMF1/EgtB/PvdO family nonheme iron enzyme [Magnetococcales bacterium]
MKKGLSLAGRYTLQKELGQGLFGDAYLAHDESTGLTVTVKTLTERIRRDERVLADVRRNFQLLQSLDHPHIVKMHALEFDALSQEHFLVREYVEGITLTEHRIRNGRGLLPLSEALEICRQIAFALDHAHRSLLHRDLKPDNILITHTGEVKLINFCLVPEHLAKEIRTENMIRDLESASRLHGYMAPEQFFGFPPPGPAADRYALAAIFYELVSGRPPFDQVEPQALMHAVCNMAPPPLREVGKRRNRVINQAMSKDPGKRFPSAMAFVDALDASPLALMGQYAGPLVIAVVAIVLSVGLGWYYQKNSGGKDMVALLDTGVDPSVQQVDPDLVGENPNQGQTVMLRVESRPSGAQVTLDGKRLGMTPLTVGQVIRGRYALKLEKTGYSDVVVDMELAEDTVVDLSLDEVLPSEPVVAVAADAKEAKPPVTDVAAKPEEDAVPSSPSQQKAPPVQVAEPMEKASVNVTAPEGTSPAVNEEAPRESDQEMVILPDPQGITATQAIQVAIRGPGGALEEAAMDVMSAVPEPPPLARRVEKASADQPESAQQQEPLPLPSPMLSQKRTEGMEASSGAPGDTTTRPEGQAVNDPRIPGLLKEASRHVRAMRLTFPEGSNALESYRAVLALVPEQKEALEGIRRIAGQLLALARDDIDEDRLSQPPVRNALARVMLAGELDPGNPKVGAFLGEIAARYITLARAAADKGDRVMVEARLAQAAAVAPEHPVVAEGYRKLLNKEWVPPVKQDQKVVEAKPVVESPASEVKSPEVQQEQPSQTASLQAAPSLPETVTPSSEVPSLPPEVSKPATAAPTVVANPSKAGAVWKDPITGMEFVELSEGCFNMGTEYGDADESPVHRVCLDSYRISKFEVTQGVWKAIMGANNNPSKFNQDDQLPVDSVSWTMAAEFIQRLNEKSSVVFRLPTEAEWENACRAGGNDPYQFGGTILTNQANFNGSQPLPGEEKGMFRKTTVVVGSFPPNRYGLFDMHGNVYEWVEDWYVKDYYGKAPEHNPLANDDSSSLHVLRGGAWHSNSGNLRCGYRYRGRPDFNNFGNGFRLASSLTSVR